LVRGPVARVPVLGVVFLEFLRVEFVAFRAVVLRTFALASGANALACCPNGLFLTFGLVAAARLI
jgi:hypothetical protein